MGFGASTIVGNLMVDLVQTDVDGIVDGIAGGAPKTLADLDVDLFGIDALVTAGNVDLASIVSNTNSLASELASISSNTDYQLQIAGNTAYLQYGGTGAAEYLKEIAEDIANIDGYIYYLSGIEYYTSNIDYGIGASGDAAATPGGTGTVNAKLRLITDELYNASAGQSVAGLLFTMGNNMSITDNIYTAFFSSNPSNLHDGASSLVSYANSISSNTGTASSKLYDIYSDTNAMVTDLAAIEVLITAGNADLATMDAALGAIETDIATIQSDIAAIKTQTDKLTFNGESSLKVVDTPPA